MKAPELIWDEFQDRLGCTCQEFDEYAAGASEVYALELDEIRPYRDRFPLVQMSHLIREELTPPQSYVTLEKNRPWAKAVSVAAYLHGCFKSTMSLALDVGGLSAARRSVSTMLALSFCRCPKLPRTPRFFQVPWLSLLIRL